MAKLNLQSSSLSLSRGRDNRLFPMETLISSATVWGPDSSFGDKLGWEVWLLCVYR